MKSIPMLVAITLCGFTLAGCEGRPSDAGGGSGQLPDQEIDGFTLAQTREGVKLWVLSADHAVVYEEAGRVEMTAVKVDFFDEDGEVRSTLTARNGLLLKRTNDMEASGNVVVTARDGTRLTTERLAWNERTGKIESELFVRVVKGRDEFTGVGISADPDLTDIKVKSDFRAYVRTPEGELVEED